jgi:tetrahydromethanopterin S-methyltransferase subunit A
LLFDLLNAADDDAIEAIVDDILSDDDGAGEAERPFLARRNPGRVYAAAVESSGEEDAAAAARR